MQPSMKLFSLIFCVLLLALVSTALIGITPSGDAAAAQQATPTLGFGPAIGPDYVPPTPLSTPIPTNLRPPACNAIVQAAELFIYSQPDALSAPIGTAYAQNRLPVSDLHIDATGGMWVAAGGGWLALAPGQTQLEAVRACELLKTRRPVKSTSFGLHLINPTGAAQVMSLVQNLQANGITLGTIKGINGTEQLLNSVKEASPNTIVVYRSLYGGSSKSDCPNFEGTSLAEYPTMAEEWLSSLKSTWDGVKADYYEVMNECPGTLEQHTAFSLEVMKLATAQNRCLLLYSFSAGQPQIEEAESMLPVMEYAAQNPCQPGRYHGIAVHNYGEEGDILLSQASEWMALRHRKLYETLIARVPSAVNVPFFITEAGPGGGGGFMNTPRCEDVYTDVVQYSYQLEQDPYVWGYHLWSFGAGTVWWDLTLCLDGIGAALIGYYGP